MIMDTNFQNHPLASIEDWHIIPIEALERHIGYCMIGFESMLSEKDNPFKIKDLSFHAWCWGGGDIEVTCVEKEGSFRSIAQPTQIDDPERYFKAFDQMLYDYFKDNPPRDLAKWQYKRGCVFPIAFVLHFIGVI